MKILYNFTPHAGDHRKSCIVKLVLFQIALRL
jgi:hypothetical protein